MADNPWEVTSEAPAQTASQPSDNQWQVAGQSPSSSGQDASQVDPNNANYIQGQAVNPNAPGQDQILQGAMKNIGSTVEGTGRILRKGLAAMSPSLAESLIPQQGLDAEKAANTLRTPEEAAGYGGEGLLELMTGNKLLQGMKLSETLKNVSQVADIFEKSPPLMKAVQAGANIAKATGELGAEEVAAIKNSPILAKIVSAGMDALRMGGIQGAQTLVKSGGDVKQAAKDAAITTAVSAPLGMVGELASGTLAKGGEAAKAVETASTMAKNAPAKEEVGQAIKGSIDAANDTMHSDYESGIQKITKDIGGATTPFKGSPIQQAAQDALQGKEEAKGVLGTEFGNITGASTESKNLLKSLTDETKTGDLNINELIQRRQQLGEKIRTLTKGATSSADRADVQVYSKLIDGIDNTIGKLAKESGNPQVVSDYDALRGAYKVKVGLFKEPVIKALQAGDLDTAAKTFLSGGKVLDKVNTLEGVVGPDKLKEFGNDILSRTMADASSESGQINPAKFTKDWKKIETLPDPAKQKLFDTEAAGRGLDKLSKDLKTAANFQRLTKYGLLSTAVGVPTHGLALPLGLLAETNLGHASEYLDKIANNPKLWAAWKLGAKVAASPTTKALGTAVKQQASQMVMGKPALANVLSGASEPLSNGQGEP